MSTVPSAYAASTALEITLQTSIWWVCTSEYMQTKTTCMRWLLRRDEAEVEYLYTCLIDCSVIKIITSRSNNVCIKVCRGPWIQGACLSSETFDTVRDILRMWTDRWRALTLCMCVCIHLFCIFLCAYQDLAEHRGKEVVYTRGYEDIFPEYIWIRK